MLAIGRWGSVAQKWAGASRCGSRGYKAVVCSELLQPPPFKQGSLAVKELPSIVPKKGEVVLDVKAGTCVHNRLLTIRFCIPVAPHPGLMTRAR
jgi:hypothetical protein